jgi:hypothetical protein
VFYFAAAMGFAFTADTGFSIASALKFGFPAVVDSGFATPLWTGMVAIARVFHLDPLLVAKVLSLFFSCAAILAAYLVGREITGDALISFCVALAFSMQGWLLQSAPSGSALPLATVLVLTGLFFILRNEYLIAIIVIGLCSLLFWQGIVLLLPFAADLWLNSVSKKRALKVGISAVLVYFAVLLPWILYARFTDLPMVPVLPPMKELPPVSVSMLILISILIAMAVAGVLLALARRRAAPGSVPVNGGAVLFGLVLVAFNPIAHSDLWLPALPIFLACSFRGVAELLFKIKKVSFLYTVSVGMCALLLALSQFDFRENTRPAMYRAQSLLDQNRIAAEWLRMNAPDRATLCAESPGVLEYYAEREVAQRDEADAPCGEFLVGSQPVVTGYAVAFIAPPGVGGELHERVAIWRRQ